MAFVNTKRPASKAWEPIMPNNAPAMVFGDTAAVQTAWKKSRCALWRQQRQQTGHWLGDAELQRILLAVPAAASRPVSDEETAGVEQDASVCIDDKTGLAAVSKAGCVPGSHPFRAASANIFNLLWNVWTPTAAPHPTHGGNLTTSLQALRDMKEANLTFFRVFASPWAAEDILLWRTATDTYWRNMSVIVDAARALGLKMHVSITPTLSQWSIAAGCGSVRELITNENGTGCQGMVQEYVTDMVRRYKNDSTILSWGMGAYEVLLLFVHLYQNAPLRCMHSRVPLCV